MCGALQCSADVRHKNVGLTREKADSIISRTMKKFKWMKLTANMHAKMKIAIVGAGAAGLAALRHSLIEGHECVTFEKTNQIGGTWVYTEKVGLDSNGLPIHSSMYAGLKTNLPKELMAYEDFPYRDQNYSFLTQPEVLQYMNDFVAAYNLLPHIQFLKHVVRIHPLPLNKWLIKVLDLKTKTSEDKEFEAVFICVGNYSVPHIPVIPGSKIYQGHIIHSHDYRHPEPFAHKKVLVIGSGPSGIDIARMIIEVADKVIMSKRSGGLLPDFPKAIVVKPQVTEFAEHTAKFEDGTEEVIDNIVFCTGYLNSYPFLTPECNIEVQNNWVKYLYKHIINVNHPTMGFLGVPTKILPFPIVTIQARFFLTFLKGQLTVTREGMMQDVLQDVQRRKEENIPMHYFHRLGLDQGTYMDDLAEIAKIKKIPPVIIKLYKFHHSIAKGDRKRNYRIISDEEFEEIKGV